MDEVDIFDSLVDDGDDLLERTKVVTRVVKAHMSCYKCMHIYDIPLVKFSTTGNIYLLAINVHTFEITCIFDIKLKNEESRKYRLNTFPALIFKTIELLNDVQSI